MNQSKRTTINEKDIAVILADRTGLEVNLVRTLMHFYERIILHSAMKGNYVRIENLFAIYHHDNKAIKHIKKK